MDQYLILSEVPIIAISYLDIIVGYWVKEIENDWPTVWQHSIGGLKQMPNFYLCEINLRGQFKRGKPYYGLTAVNGLNTSAQRPWWVLKLWHLYHW